MIRTSATDKIFALKKRIRICAGGTSASKTISILLWMIQRAQQNEGELLSVISESFPHLRRGSMRDFLSIMEEHKYFQPDRWNKTDCIYTFETGSRIEFFSADQPGKVRGPRRDIMFINEANNISYETYTQLEIRTKKIIWIDFNPTQEFWVYTDVMPIQDNDFITLTYKDNEALDKSIIDTIESRRGNKNWWRVYGEGKLGEVESRIYTGWQILDEIPHEARIERYGLDFGYSNDPSALVAIYYYNGGYVLDEKIYQKGLSNKQLADLINNLPKALVIADSAEPKSIDEIKSYGVNIIPVEKGKDSVSQGIQFVQQQRISVTKQSINLLKEYRNYLWETDKEGKIINEPIGIWNHCFVGNTEIRTSNGYKQIKDIKKGDWVLTSKGIRPVLKRWNNGVKQVNKYSLQFDTFNVILEATPDHKIKTTKGWKKISKLQSGMEIYHNNYLGVKSTTSTQKKDISQEAKNVCTLRSGNTTMAQSPRDFMSTTKTKILGTIDYLISFWSGGISISHIMVKEDSQSLWYSLEPSKQKVFKQLKFGTQAPMELNGIGNTLRINGSQLVIQNVSVNSAGNLIKQDTRVYPSIAIQTAKLKHLGVEEGKKEKVYDLMVDGCHEYFANTILVSNCMDAVRYGFDGLRDKTEIPLGMNDFRNWSI